MYNEHSRIFIGLGKDVDIHQTTLCFGWKHLRPPKLCVISTKRLAPIQIDAPNGTPSIIRSIADDEALDQWAPDSFDMVVIHVPPYENASGTYKQLIRVARQGLILLGATRS